MKASIITRVAGVALLAAMCAFGFAACSSDNKASAGTAATVNGTEISEQAITDRITAYREARDLTDAGSWGAWLAENDSTPAAQRDALIDYYVDNELTKQGAAEKGIEVSDDKVDAQISIMKQNYSSEEAFEKALSSVGMTKDQYRESVYVAMLQNKLYEAVAAEAEEPTDEELLAALTRYATAFNGAKRSSHILFSGTDEATAQEVLGKLKAGEITFEDAAKQYSIDTGTKDKGGDLGWDKLSGEFVTEFKNGLAALGEGQMSDLVTTSYGIHIIKCTGVFTAPEEVTSIDQVPAELSDYVRTVLKNSKGSTAYQTWMNEFKEKADIQKKDMPEGLPYDVDMAKYTSADASSDSAEGEGESGDSAAETSAGEDESESASSDSAAPAESSTSTSEK